MERDPLNLNQFLQDFRDREDKSSFFTRARKSGFPYPLDSTPSLRFRDSTTSASGNKRPFDDTVLNMNDSLIKRKRRLTLDDSAGSDSLNTTVGTPWETKHMRSALAQARAEVKSLESKVGEISGKLKETILQQEHERNTYKSNLDRERTTINDLEKRIRLLKRREEKMRTDLSEALQHVNQDRDDYENKMVQYHKENSELKQQIIECDAEKKRLELETKTVQMECARLKSDLGSANDQVAAVSAQMSQLRNSLKESESVKSALADSLQRVKELESELHSQSENAAVVQAQQAKLMKYSELERQLKSLTNLNTKLKESSKHSFYLETVVDGLKDRLAMVETTERELMEMRVQCGLVEAKLDEYKRAVDDVLGAGGTPTQLVHYIRKVQEESLEVANRHSQLQCRLKSLEETKATADTVTSKLNDEINNLKKELESCNANFRRLKKQNALITWERNDLRSLVDSCQKEVTLGGLHDPRTEALEKLVEGYRKKLEQIENDPSLAPSSSTNTADAAELRKLKKENELLRQKLIKLELESEQEVNKKVILLK
uniref:Mitotic spindle assembly checkpoint protein MAD1 n=1 Tax=Lygus hesperus TaxID=30085 RepID=A0A0A9ZEE4_LYGHE